MFVKYNNNNNNNTRELYLFGMAVYYSAAPVDGDKGYLYKYIPIHTNTAAHTANRLLYTVGIYIIYIIIYIIILTQVACSRTVHLAG